MERESLNCPFRIEFCKSQREELTHVDGASSEVSNWPAVRGGAFSSRTRIRPNLRDVVVRGLRRLKKLWRDCDAGDRSWRSHRRGEGILASRRFPGAL